jgi:hypothetical protein
MEWSEIRDHPAFRYAPCGLQGGRLPRRGGVDGKGMHATGKLGGKRRVYQAMALEPALPGEGLRHDIHPEMTFPAGTMTSVALVPVRLIEHPQALRAESFGQLPCDEVVGSHRPALATLASRRQRAAAAHGRNEQKPFVKLAAGAFRSA